MQHRRKHHAEFRHKTNVAIIMANARFQEQGGRRGPKGKEPQGDPAAIPHRSALRTSGGEPVVVRRRDGKLQLRAAQPGKLTQQCEQAFLSALCATANVRLAAAAAGASVAAFYRRRRQNPGFAREMRLALTAGYERLEVALLESAAPAAYEDDAWRHNDPPAMPPMTANQALQLLYLHQKEARLWAERPDRQRRRGESTDLFSARLAAKWRAEKAREAEERAVEEADRAAFDARSHNRPVPHEPPPLPDLAQVTGWSKASGKPPHHDDTALFGGWRLGDVGKKKKVGR